jgi:putative IMPACT (imprinted ancient) family translation regulator
MVRKTLACQYTQVNDVLYFIEQIGGEIIQQDYNENIVLTLAIPEQKIELFQQQLQTLSAGQLLLKSITKKQ